MTIKRALVLTTINAPNEALRLLASGAQTHDIPFIVIGDTKSPPDFTLPPARYVPIEGQEKMFPDLCRVLPHKHYTRKNVGYLIAIQEGASEIQETDDDNLPRAGFWEATSETVEVEIVKTEKDWFNIYSLFSDELIWARGFPLQFINDAGEFKTESGTSRGLILQGLADENPDVDAVFRLTRKLPVNFNQRPAVMLAPGVWSPFNSQNTIFKREVFPLLYLPSKCSFRMTDIWRSFVAQRCLWETGEGVVFHSATVYQERNEHNLLRDFEDEVPGYLLNDKIRQSLEDCRLEAGDMTRNLSLCYEALVKDELLQSDELPILREWCRALEQVN